MKANLPKITFLLTLLGCGSAMAELSLVSTDAFGVKGTSQSTWPDISADGRHVAFLTSAPNLRFGTNGQVVVKDTASGAIETVSIGFDGSPANSIASRSISISGDGRYVIFYSLATNIVPGDTNGTWDIFWRDRQTGEVKIVGIAPDGSQANGEVAFGAISADGRYVAFRSRATNLVATPVSGAQVYVQDMLTGETQLVSRNSSGSPQGGGEPDISSDGRWVVFRGIPLGVYRVDTLNCNDSGCDVVRADVNNAGSPVAGHTSVLFPKISGNGSFVTWESNAPGYVAGDTNGVADVFVRDIASAITTRVSVASDGTQGNGDSLTPDISDDGRYVSFTSSASNLVALDSNGFLDLFLHDRATGQTTQLSLTAGGTSPNAHASYYASMAGNGSAVAFSSVASDMVAADTDSVEDIYLAVLTPPNSAPVAEAGESVETAVGEPVTLIGLNSTDDKDSPFELTYQWSIGAAPQGSTASLSAPGSATTGITPDLPGDYSIDLVVTDTDGASSAIDSVSIRAGVVPAYVFKLIAAGTQDYSRAGQDYNYEYDFPIAIASDDEALTYYHYSSSYDSATRVGSYAFDIRESDGVSDESRLAQGQALSGTDTLDYFSEYRKMPDGDLRFSGRIRRDDGMSLRSVYGAWSLTPEGTLSSIVEFPAALANVARTIPYGYHFRHSADATAFQYSLQPASYKEWTWIAGDGTSRTSRYYDHEIYVARNGAINAVWDTTRPIPGTTEIPYYAYVESVNEDGDVLIRTGYPQDETSGRWNQALIRVDSDGNAATIVDTGGDNEFEFLNFGQSELDGNSTLVGLYGLRNGLYERSIYRDSGAGLEREIAGPYLTRADSTSYAYLNPWNYSYVDGDFLFYGYPDVLARIDGRLRTVVSRGQSLDGVVPDYVYAGAISGNDLLSAASVGVNGQTTLTAEFSSSDAYHYAYGRQVFHGRLDTDRDSIADSADNCRYRPNPQQEDGDGNGIGDVCEDSDADGLPDVLDNCPVFPNADQANSDLDSFGDACDVCVLVADEQSDLDGDGMGDACDPDADGDLVDDIVDNCPVLANPAPQSDLDTDGLGDPCDPDKDGDGIANSIDGSYDGVSFADESSVSSANFTDQHLGGSTFGQLLGGNGTTWLVEDGADSAAGVLIASSSAAKLRRCGEARPITWPGGAAMEMSCTSTSVRTLYGLVEIAMDDDEEIFVSATGGTDLRLVSEPSGEFAVLASPLSAIPVEVTLRDTAKLVIGAATTAIVEETSPGQFLIENSSGSMGTISATIDGQVVSFGAGDYGVPVRIDIKPGADDNAINLGSNGNVPVAVFSSPTFDATSLDPLTISLANAAIRLKGKGTPQFSVQDVDGDGLPDLLVHIDTSALELAPDATQAEFAGTTWDAVPVRSTDSIVVVND